MTVSPEKLEEKKRAHMTPAILIILGVLLLALICLPITIIVSLALYGQAIGDVFSQIAAELEGPVMVEGEGFSLAYPANWQPIEVEEPAICQESDFDCLLHLAPLGSDGSNLNMMHYNVAPDISFEEFESLSWNAFSVQHPGTAFDSREMIEVAGRPAVRRIFQMPIEGVMAGEAHLQNVLILDGSMVYEFTLWTPSAESLDKYGQDLDDILASLKLE